MSDNNDQSREMEPVTNGPPGEAREQASEAASEQSRNGQAKAPRPREAAANRANAQHSTDRRQRKGRKGAVKTAAHTDSIPVSFSRSGRKVTGCSGHTKTWLLAFGSTTNRWALWKNSSWRKSLPSPSVSLASWVTNPTL